MTQPYSTSGPRPGALRAFRDSFSGLGLLIGALLLAASLTPSLIPRAPALQGVLAGTCMAIGYLAGVVLEWLWRFLGLPLPRAQTVRIANWIAAAAAAAVVVSYLWRAAGWQNSIRVLMDMPPVTSSEPLLVGAVTGVVFLVLLLLGREDAPWTMPSEFLPAARALGGPEPRLEEAVLIGLTLGTLLNALLNAWRVRRGRRAIQIGRTPLPHDRSELPGGALSTDFSQKSS